MVQFSGLPADKRGVGGKANSDLKTRVRAAAPEHGAGLWDHGPVGAFRTDSEGNWIAVNPRWSDITGVSAKQALAHSGPWGEVHPDDQSALLEGWAAMLKSGERTDIAFRFNHPERGLRYAIVNAATQHDDDGNVVEIIGTLVDETERRVAEKALRDSEELHRLTMSNLPGAAVGLYDRDMRCLLMEGIEGQGMTTETCRGKHISELAPPESVADLMPGIEAALAGHEFKGEFRVGETEERWTYNAAPYRDARAEITGFMIIAQDVTEQRRAEQESRMADNLFRVAFDSAPVGMVIFGLDKTFVQVNHAFEQMLGIKQGGFSSRPIIDVIHPEDVTTAEGAFARVAEDGQSSIEIRLVAVDDRVIWVDVVGTLVRDDHGNPIHVLAQIRDVT
jgi:PAS domain S-box-containing protein